MAHKTIEVPINRLYLDQDNARHDPLDNEPEIIEQLLKKEKAGAIAKSIAEAGALNPLERVGVVAHPAIKGGYVVIEGNRRVSALKILHDPDKAPTESIKRQVLGYKAKGSIVPSLIEVVLFDSEEEAAPWISMRHHGEDGGVGLRPWTVSGKSRHAAKVGGQNVNQLAVSLVSYAAKIGLLSEAEKAQVPLTTITRYLGNPIFRHTIGLASNKEIQIEVPQNEFDSVLKVFLKDSLPKSVTGVEPKVHSRSNADEWKRYAKELDATGHSPKTRLTKTVPLKAPSPVSSKLAPKLANPDKRSSVVGTAFRYSFSGDPILSRLCRELRTIDAGSHSFAAAYLFRAFIERLSKCYAKRHRLGADGDLHQVIGRCIAHLDKNTSLQTTMGSKAFKSALQPLRGMVSDRYGRTSPDTLGSWVHGSSVPSRAEINRRWDTLEPGLKLLADGVA